MGADAIEAAEAAQEVKLETRIDEKGCVSVVEMQPVIKESFSPEQLQNEMDSILSELDNFAVVMQNRQNYLNERMAYLIKIKSALNEGKE